LLSQYWQAVHLQGSNVTKILNCYTPDEFLKLKMQKKNLFSARVLPWTLVGRAQLISQGKIPNFTAVFGKKCQISLKVICCSLKPQNHLPALIHKDYLRYLKAINVKNVTNGHFTVH